MGSCPAFSGEGQVSQRRTRGLAASRRTYSTCIRHVGPPLYFLAIWAYFEQASRSGSVVSRGVQPSACVYRGNLAFCERPTTRVWSCFAARGGVWPRTRANACPAPARVLPFLFKYVWL